MAKPQAKAAGVASATHTLAAKVACEGTGASPKARKRQATQGSGHQASSKTHTEGGHKPLATASAATTGMLKASTA